MQESGPGEFLRALKILQLCNSESADFFEKYF